MSGRSADTCFAGVFSCTSCTQPFWKLSQFHFPLYKRHDPADLLHRLAETNATIGTAFGQKKKRVSLAPNRTGGLCFAADAAGGSDFVRLFHFYFHHARATARATHTHTRVSGWAVECFCVSAV